MIVYAKPVLFWVVVLLLNRPADRPFPLIFTSILSSLNGLETLQCYKSKRPHKYNHPCKYWTFWLQSTEGISWYHILGAMLCLSNTSKYLEGECSCVPAGCENGPLHVCTLGCLCISISDLYAHMITHMNVRLHGWMNALCFVFIPTYTDRRGTVWRAVVHAATPQLTTSIITSSGCKSANVRPASAPLDVWQSSSKKRWEERTKEQKGIQREAMEMLWMSGPGRSVQRQSQSLKERAEKEARSNPPVAVKLSISWKTSVLVKKAKPSSVFCNPDRCFCGSGWGLHIRVTLFAKKHNHVVCKAELEARVSEWS